jgi:hypothetical protein
LASGIRNLLERNGFSPGVAFSVLVEIFIEDGKKNVFWGLHYRNGIT